ncbi:MAG: BatD family protein [Pontibacterium sp.]
MVRHFQLLVVLLLISFNVQAMVSSRVDPAIIEQGETVRLAIDMEGRDQDSVALESLQKDFDILARSQQSSTVIRNGRIESKTELVLTLLPKRAGDLEIPALEIDGDKTRPHLVIVRPVKQLSAAEGGFEMMATLSSQTPRVQQPLVYQMSLLIGQQVYDASLQPPEIKTGNALIEPLGEQKQYQQTLNGREMMVVEQAWLVTPEKSGPLEISSARLQGKIRTGRRSQNQFSNGIYGGSSSMKHIQVTANTYQLDVDVIPGRFSGAVWLPAEKLVLSDSWSHSEVTEGEPVTRTLTLQVEGLSSNQLPELKWPEVAGIKQYAATPVPNQQYINNRLISGLTLEVTLIPSRAGELILPEIRIPWWDVKNNREQVAVLPAKKLRVLAAAPVAGAPKVNQAAQPLINLPGHQNSQNAQLTEQAGTVAAATSVQSGPESTNGWLLALAGAVAGSVLTLIAGVFWCKRLAKPVVAEAKIVVPDSRQQLKALRQACDNNDSAAARSALLAWGASLIPGCSNLNQLCDQLSPELQSLINELNRAGYGRTEQPWQGDKLWKAVQAFDTASLKTNRVGAEGLAPLYQGMA